MPRSTRSVALAPLLLLSGLTWAQPHPEAVVETKSFFIPDKGPMVQVNTSILGGSLQPPAGDGPGTAPAQLEVTTIIERHGEVADFRKTLLNGPPPIDGRSPDLFHQERFTLSPGDYALEVAIKDLNGRDTTYRMPLAVPAPPTGPAFSDILLVNPDVPRPVDGSGPVPFSGTYFPDDVNTLAFYTELYHMDEALGNDSMYLLISQLEEFEKHQVFGNFRRLTRTRAHATEPLSGRFDINDLPSGNYILAIEARDRNGDLVARKEQFIQRNNPISYDLNDTVHVGLSGTFVYPINDPDTLAEYLSGMRPIADDLERHIIDQQVDERDPERMKRFLFSFWSNRNSFDPEGVFKAYEVQVDKVNKLFGTRIKRGYSTDRGRVWLKYGAPNSVTDRPADQNAYPYQIWHYYRAGRYTNRRFVFYQPDLVTNDYELLHSEVPGEIQNPRWNQLIHSRNTPQNNVDVAPVNSISGERLQEFYDDPR
ncbi:MAG: GWxTD domain-containing protein [Flavobacteriales bacterium]|nr:GWxTD domain-containing protein [Flavobacteriales bacterium]MCB9193821.1 GWxTD domain-containing protein [Flavobacteriales bacterium]